MTTLRDKLKAAGAPGEEGGAAQASDADRRIAALERAVATLRRDLMFVRYAALIAAALAAGLLLRLLLQG